MQNSGHVSESQTHLHNYTKLGYVSCSSVTQTTLCNH